MSETKEELLALLEKSVELNNWYKTKHDEQEKEIHRLKNTKRGMGELLTDAADSKELMESRSSSTSVVSLHGPYTYAVVDDEHILDYATTSLNVSATKRITPFNAMLMNIPTALHKKLWIPTSITNGLRHNEKAALEILHNTPPFRIQLLAAYVARILISDAKQLKLLRTNITNATRSEKRFHDAVFLSWLLHDHSMANCYYSGPFGYVAGLAAFQSVSIKQPESYHSETTNVKNKAYEFNTQYILEQRGKASQGKVYLGDTNDAPAPHVHLVFPERIRDNKPDLLEKKINKAAAASTTGLTAVYCLFRRDQTFENNLTRFQQEALSRHDKIIHITITNSKECDYYFCAFMPKTTHVEALFPTDLTNKSPAVLALGKMFSAMHDVPEFCCTTNAEIMHTEDKGKTFKITNYGATMKHSTTIVKSVA